MHSGGREAAGETKPRFNHLSVGELFNLDHACKAVTAAFGPFTYQVGSSLTRSNYRDVDLRCILDDADFDSMLGAEGARAQFLNIAVSEWLTARTGLPIDFQFQRRTEANIEHGGPRSFVG